MQPRRRRRRNGSSRHCRPPRCPPPPLSQDPPFPSPEKGGGHAGWRRPREETSRRWEQRERETGRGAVLACFFFFFFPSWAGRRNLLSLSLWTTAVFGGFVWQICAARKREGQERLQGGGRTILEKECERECVCRDFLAGIVQLEFRTPPPPPDGDAMRGGGGRGVVAHLTIPHKRVIVTNPAVPQDIPSFRWGGRGHHPRAFPGRRARPSRTANKRAAAVGRAMQNRGCS